MPRRFLHQYNIYLAAGPSSIWLPKGARILSVANSIDGMSFDIALSCDPSAEYTEVRFAMVYSAINSMEPFEDSVFLSRQNTSAGLPCFIFMEHNPSIIVTPGV